MRRIGRDNAGRRWEVLPQEPALAYELAHNRLIVTAAMLQAPVLDASMPAAARCGAFRRAGRPRAQPRGRHARPAGGRQGRVAGLVDTTEAAAWGRQAAAGGDLYDGFAYPQLGNVKVNGRLTRDAAIADIAGLGLALRCLMKGAAGWRRGSRQGVLPRLGARLGATGHR